MIYLTSFNTLPQFSKFFMDFNSSNVNLNKLFYSNLINNDILNKILNNYKNRDFLCNFFCSDTNQHINSSQINNIEKLKENNTLAVVTGQQTGLFGGPLYTLYKAFSAIELSNKLSVEYQDYNFVPIFWVEDNDHDKEEASYANFFDVQNEPFSHKLQFEENRQITGNQIVGSEIHSIIEDLKSKFSFIQNYEERISIIENCYQEGRKWTDSFIMLLNELLGDYGLLFISANKILETGIFKELVLSEINKHSENQQIIQNQIDILNANDYHTQVPASDINLFYLDNNERFKITPLVDNMFLINEHKYTKNELLDIAENSPEKFTPKVLLRPLFQDFILPTSHYVAGPGEIAYLAEITELYKAFNLEMPIIENRHSITFVDKKINKILTKYEKNIEYFFQDYKIILDDLTANMIDESTETQFIDIKEEIAITFNKLSSIILNIDSQLDKTIATSQAKCIEQIDLLHKKTIASLKRQNSDLINKYKAVSNSIFPHSKYQERYYSIAQFFILFGKEKLLTIIEESCKHKSDKHIIYYDE